MRRPFRYLREPLFLGAVAIYAVNRTLSKHELNDGNDFFRHYLNDVLLVPVVLPLILTLSTVLGLRQTGLPPRLHEVMVPVIIWSVAFELIGPAWLRRGTGDAFDVLAYASGGVLCWLIWQRRGRGSSAVAPGISGKAELHSTS